MAVLLVGNGDRAERVVGVAGLHPDHPWPTAEKDVGIGQVIGPVTLDRYLARGDDLAKERVLHRCLGDDEQVVGARDVAVRMQPVRVGEMRIGEAESVGFGIHLGDERRLAAANCLGDHDGGVITRRDQQAIEQVAQGETLGRTESHDRVAGELARVHVGRHDLIEVAGLKREQRGHDLGHAGRRQSGVNVFPPDERSRIAVDNRDAARGNGWNRRNLRSRQTDRANRAEGVGVGEAARQQDRRAKADEAAGGEHQE